MGLNKFTGNNRGIKNKQLREIYVRGTERIITYAAPVWYKCTNNLLKRLKSTQRKPLLSITKAYKTVSNNALNVLANLPPVHLKIEKEIEINNFEAEAVAITKALEYITLQNNSASYQILTDSLSTLQGISNPDNLNPYIYQIKETIRKVNKNHKIILTFIKGHSGNIGNEYADDLAKKAIRYGEEIDLPISKKFINNGLEHVTHDAKLS
ncbi:uncharacterized protein [Dermacentor albipictus]|uniref:uncharacterized protein n=1 Tax=Dermacentor albipictus TaxID=60249 RepID=UPI0038FC8786